MHSKSSSLITLTLLFSFLFLQQTYSQTNLQPGSVITKSGDTLKGFIDYRNWEKNPDEISFCESVESLQIKYNPNSIGGFIVNNEVYLSAVVTAEISPIQTNELDFEPKILTRTDTSFVQVMFSGKKNLYFYSDKMGKQNFYIGQWPDFELLVYKKYLKEEKSGKFIAENKNFIGQLNLYMQDCPSLKAKISSATYDKKSLSNLFNAYYYCIDGRINYQSVQEKPRFDFGILAGISKTELNLSSNEISFENIVNTYYPASLNFSGGLYMDFVLARNQRKWSIYNELLLSSYMANGQSEEYFNENYYKTYDISIGYSYLKLNTMMRFTYPVLSKDLFLFVNLGMSNGYAISETNSMTKEVIFYSDPVITEEPAMKETRKYEQGFIAGLGIKYSKLSFETRFEGANGMSVYSSLNAKTNRIYFLFGYRF